MCVNEVATFTSALLMATFKSSKNNAGGRCRILRPHTAYIHSVLKDHLEQKIAVDFGGGKSGLLKRKKVQAYGWSGELSEHSKEWGCSLF